jgi:pSer/pThr/pTyr-binding forkhead associated (FHA) protein
VNQYPDPFPAPDVPAYFRTQPEIVDDRTNLIPRTPTAREAPQDDAIPFRPVSRPPVAVLVVQDDGRNEGQTVRLRSETFTIGRTEGDLVLPHDGMISRKHAVIHRKADRGRFKWVLEDLKSQNGTFVRVSDAILSHGQVILLGSRRYVFNAPTSAAALDTSGGDGTKGWKAVDAADLIPSVREEKPDGSFGERIFLTEDEAVIGRGPGCHVTLTDPMVSPRHARLFKDDRGNWVIENQGSLNGTWVRVDTVTFEKAGQFLIGEQRFTLRV